MSLAQLQLHLVRGRVGASLCTFYQDGTHTSFSGTQSSSKLNARENPCGHCCVCPLCVVRVPRWTKQWPSESSIQAWPRKSRETRQGASNQSVALAVVPSRLLLECVGNLKQFFQSQEPSGRLAPLEHQSQQNPNGRHENKVHYVTSIHQPPTAYFWHHYLAPNLYSLFQDVDVLLLYAPQSHHNKTAPGFVEIRPLLRGCGAHKDGLRCRQSSRPRDNTLHVLYRQRRTNMILERVAIRLKLPFLCPRQRNRRGWAGGLKT